MANDDHIYDQWLPLDIAKRIRVLLDRDRECAGATYWEQNKVEARVAELLGWQVPQQKGGPYR